MKREIHATEKAPGAIGPYSQAVIASGEIVFCSGQIPLTPAGDRVDGSVAEQAEQVMKNINGMLESLGVGFENIAKTTIFLSSMEHFGTVNEVYGRYVGSAPPARSTVAVAGLPMGFDVEIEVIVVR